MRQHPAASVDAVFRSRSPRILFRSHLSFGLCFRDSFALRLRLPWELEVAAVAEFATSRKIALELEVAAEAEFAAKEQYKSTAELSMRCPFF